MERVYFWAVYHIMPFLWSNIKLEKEKSDSGLQEEEHSKFLSNTSTIIGPHFWEPQYVVDSNSGI